MCAQSVFAKGERVVGLVCMVSPDYEKVSISTMELEQKVSSGVEEREGKAGKE